MSVVCRRQLPWQSGPGSPIKQRMATTHSIGLGKEDVEKVACYARVATQSASPSPLPIPLFRR